ncbi:SpoIIE-like protein phosphatase domain protein [Leptospira inadai serovar Lyme str. 10]|uniref:SpoIIE-like protein phosphatase domain protein n=2 Tax=Leptospira inadai serovar Lyme TaxID=293084 RepID=V6H9H7_9LEPT|nr:SpoIIE family protein phosphatase [Leptospira inadai]EQA34808.1 SpoIIE-like protein phosphatase domain protein [Leptospira inadai serovar Lyme str. 10]PNV75354.1 serine/threonine protein phosphatase [Leptospira inadai serovar Lyme]
MGLDTISWDLVLFNYYSFGSLLVTLTTFLLGSFFLTLKNKTVATTHLGIGFLLFTFFETGYFVAAFLYHPFASYHRWITGGFILPALTHFTQFLLRFPGNSNQRLARWVLIVEYSVIAIVVSFFIYLTSISENIYHFTAHHWDFNAYDASRYLAIVIAIESIVGFLIIPTWRVIVTKDKRRIALLMFTIGFLIAAIYPNISNVVSRDGAMERSTYMTSNVIFFVMAFSVLAIAFINNSAERTTFMVKIVGITLFTICLIMQALVYISSQEKDAEYDSLKMVNIERAIENGVKTKDIEYIIRWNDNKNSLLSGEYDKKIDLNLMQVEIDLQNVTIYEEIRNLDEKNFRSKLREVLEKTHTYFGGYKRQILEFVDQNTQLSDGELKAAILGGAEKWNKQAFIATNRLEGVVGGNFCKKGRSFIDSLGSESHKKEIFSHWSEDCLWDGKQLSDAQLREEVLRYFRYFKPSETRHYRRSRDGYGHYVAFMKFSPETLEMSEVGFSYLVYRQFMHPTAVKQTIILLIVIFVVLVLFPLFFKNSLVDPLNGLLAGVEKVNKGDLDVVVPVKVRDEIGFLADSFNAMVASIKQARRELQDYAENLEEKVKERTKEVQEKMEEVQRLKVQQDGDYFLTSLLAKPLFYNANKSKHVSTEFIIRQKKQFEFRGKHSDLGGDICVTGNLRLGRPDSFKRFTVAMNGDAMGKSMQGAGGALVMGVVMNSILARSAANNRILETTPEQWLGDIYHEIHSVFKSFNGSMVISACVYLVEDETGKCWYFNAEHPFTVLYRDGKASFIEEGLTLRKLGLDSEFDFKVHTLQLKKGDILILGSDGRDDVDLTPDETIRTINEDETLFLRHVEKAKANLEEIETEIRKTGELTDDLSLLKIEFQTEPKKDEIEDIFDDADHIDKALNTDSVYEEARKLYKTGHLEEALDLLKTGYMHDSANQKLNKLLGLLSFKGKDYATAVEVLNNYLGSDPDLHEYWFYLSIANKKMGKYDLALSASLKLLEVDPDNLSNLVNLADIYRLMEMYDRAEEYARKILQREPGNENAHKLIRLIERDR